ncbi:MAG: DUF58 domain-containing protein [Myxococcota bacterium]
MTPHLTSRGLWLFLSAVAFLSAGAIGENLLLVVFGQLQVLVLTLAFLLCVVSALALDRRFVSVSVRDETGEDVYSTTGHTVGKPVHLQLEIRNCSTVPLFGLELSGFGSESLQMSSVDDSFQLASRSKTHTHLDVVPQRSGRWLLHGFDVAISDPLGLLQTRDYLPCIHAFECYPATATSASSLTRRRSGPPVVRRGGQHAVPQVGQGSVIRELRDYQPGDPLRNVAWKATTRMRRLISRDFEREVTLNVYVFVDMSPSMRGGQWKGRKLEHAITTAIELADMVIGARDRVGVITFDEKLYGHIAPGMSPGHMRRISHHLVGLNTVVDPDLAEFDERDVLEQLVQYLLVQERLDFRRGREVNPETGINERLLARWLRSVARENTERYESPILHEGILDETESAFRRFAQLRGLEIPYRAEARLGMKERGLREALESMIQSARDSQRVVIISDLCSIMNPELLAESLQLAQIQGHQLEFLVPFTPAYYDAGSDDSERYTVVRELFSAAEREERLEIASHIRSLGIPVRFMKPGQGVRHLLGSGRAGRVRAAV